MPRTLISTRAGWASDPAAVMEAVQAALVSALKIPAHDRALRLAEFDDSHLIAPPERGPRYTLVEVTLFAGRSLAAKRALYTAVVENLGALGVPANDVTIVLIEVPAENWGIRGGQAACDVDLGFEVKI